MPVPAELNGELDRAIVYSITQIASDDKGGAITTWYDCRDYDVLNNGVLEGVDVLCTAVKQRRDRAVEGWR